MTRNEFLTEYNTELKPLLHLIRQAGSTDLKWRPRPDMMSTGQVIHHLSEGLAMALQCLNTGEWPLSGEAMLPPLDKIPAIASVDVALAALQRDRSETEKVLAGLSEADFGSKQVSVPWGESGLFWRLAFSFLEHLKMHKMQLFLYLRLQGLPLNTMDLYMG